MRLQSHLSVAVPFLKNSPHGVASVKYISSYSIWKSWIKGAVYWFAKKWRVPHFKTQPWAKSQSMGLSGASLPEAGPAAGDGK
jgi:YHS domain-containing protein